MHELAMCQGVLETVLGVSGNRPVRRVQLSIGADWAVSRESFDQSFEIAAQDTPAAGAVVEQEPVSGDALVIKEIELEGGEVLTNPQVTSCA